MILFVSYATMEKAWSILIVCLALIIQLGFGWLLVNSFVHDFSTTYPYHASSCQDCAGSVISFAVNAGS